MLRRRAQPPEPDPIVTDRHGRVVGIRTPPPESPAETTETAETKASRRWRLHTSLAATDELRRQAALRNEVAVFHVDPIPYSRR